ncbi:MAG: twin-arginine translocase TatA/TatE family subunit [Lentisphaeria bacterium]|nr:twin-arginine translocase TatA/TatE family subunit [Lentisphaeria bacterium]
MLGGIGPLELTLIFLVVLLIFGGRKIPEVARGLGKGLREFKKARDDFQDAIESDVPEPGSPAKQKAVEAEGEPTAEESVAKEPDKTV